MGWRHRAYLLYQTTRAAFLAQEKNSALGILWHLLNPLAMTAVLYVVFSGVGRMRDVEQYPLFILIGLVHFNFFANAIGRAADGMLQSRAYVLNTTVPIETLVLRQVCLEALTFVIELALILTFIVVFGQGLTANALYYVPVALGLFMLTIGVALLMCSVVVYLTDLTYIWGVATRMLFFLTPIFYSLDMIDSGAVTRIISLNPLAYLILAARDCLLYGEPVASLHLVSALLGPLVFLTLGWKLFGLSKKRIPDYI